MGSFKNHTGARFGRLVVVAQDISATGRHKKWLCRCDCGKPVSCYASNLTGGKSTSCGCRDADQVERSRVVSTKHGMSRTRTYKSWMSMKGRCLNPDDQKYADYGARGIKVCERWQSGFETFLEDMGEAPDGKTIDRINNDGNYEPGNCRWATRKEQANNRRVTVMLTANGKTQCLSDWAKDTGLDIDLIRNRISLHGWSHDKAINTPKGKRS